MFVDHKGLWTTMTHAGVSMALTMVHMVHPWYVVVQPMRDCPWGVLSTVGRFMGFTIDF